MVREKQDQWIIVLLGYKEAIPLIEDAHGYGIKVAVADRRKDPVVSSLADLYIQTDIARKKAVDDIYNAMVGYDVVGVVLAPCSLIGSMIVPALSKRFGVRDTTGIWAKDKQIEIFEENNIPIPVSRKAGLVNYPLVLKPPLSASGTMIEKCDDPECVNRWLSRYNLRCDREDDGRIEILYERDRWISQEFISGDYYTFFVCGDYRHILRRNVEQFRTVNAEKCIRGLNIDNDIFDKINSVGFAAAMACWPFDDFVVGNVDLVVSGNDVYVLEVNPRVGRDDQELAVLTHGIRLHQMIVGYLLGIRGHDVCDSKFNPDDIVKVYRFFPEKLFYIYSLDNDVEVAAYKNGEASKFLVSVFTRNGVEVNRGYYQP